MKSVKILLSIILIMISLGIWIQGITEFLNIVLQFVNGSIKPYIDWTLQVGLIPLTILSLRKVLRRFGGLVVFYGIIIAIGGLAIHFNSFWLVFWCFLGAMLIPMLLMLFGKHLYYFLRKGLERLIALIVPTKFSWNLILILGIVFIWLGFKVEIQYVYGLLATACGYYIFYLVFELITYQH